MTRILRNLITCFFLFTLAATLQAEEIPAEPCPDFPTAEDVIVLLFNECGIPEGCSTSEVYCALFRAEELAFEGSICESLHLEVKHQLELELARVEGFCEGYEAGFQDGAATCDTCEECKECEECKSCKENHHDDHKQYCAPEDNEDENGKIAICHVPPGNSTRARVLHVGSGAISGHLGHGDYFAPCEKSQQYSSGKKRKGKKRKKRRKGKKR